MTTFFEVHTAVSMDRAGNTEYRIVSKHKTLRAAQQAIRTIAKREIRAKGSLRGMPLHLIADDYEIRHGSDVVRYSVDQ